MKHLGPADHWLIMQHKGVHVTLVCATRGEVGEISDPALATPDTLGEVREGELRCAAESMGVQQVIFLDYRELWDGRNNRKPRPQSIYQCPCRGCRAAAGWHYPGNATAHNRHV